MFSPRLPYQVQTADMFPPTNNKKSVSVPKSVAADAQTPLTGSAAPSAAPQPLQGSAAFSTVFRETKTLVLG